MTAQSPQQAPPLRLMMDQVRSACEINEGQRRHLIERIAQLQAMSDDRLAEAQTHVNAGREAQAQPLRAEGERLGMQARMLMQRVDGLLAEMYGAGQGATAQTPVPRKPWQKDTFWAELEILSGWLAWLCEKLTPEASARIGKAATGVLSDAWSALLNAEKRKQAITESMTPAQELTALVGFADRLLCIPWHLICSESEVNDSRQLVLRFEALAELAGGERLPPSDVQLDEDLSGFAERLPKDHPDQPRLTAVGVHVDGKRYRDAAAMLLGLSPPDPLRFAQALIAKRLVVLEGTKGNQG